MEAISERDGFAEIYDGTIAAWLIVAGVCGEVKVRVSANGWTVLFEDVDAVRHLVKEHVTVQQLTALKAYESALESLRDAKERAEAARVERLHDAFPESGEW